MGKKLAAGIAIVLIVGAALYAGLKMFTRMGIERELSARVSEIPAVESLEYETLDAGLPGTWFCLKNVSLKIRDLDEKIVIGEFRVPDYRMESGELTGLTLEMDRVRIPSAYDISAMFRVDGPTSGTSGNPTANLRLVYSYEPVSRTLDVKKFSVVAAEGLDADISLRLNNFDLHGISMNDPAASIPFLMGVSVAHADIHCRDSSVLKRVLTTGGNAPVPALRPLLNAISGEIKRLKRNSGDANAVESLEKIRSFLKNPERIRITASPEKPVSLVRFLWLKKPTDIIGLMNVRVEL